MNISSLVVKVLPVNIDPALETLRRSALCDVHFHDRQKGTVVVTIEGKDTGEEMDKMKEIEKLPHVLGAALVYAYSEAELNNAVKKIAEKRGNPVPEELKNA
jgi:periplasmic nitrate reductase NapD